MLDVGDFRIYVTSVSHCVVKYFTVVVDVVFAENALFGSMALKDSQFLVIFMLSYQYNHKCMKKKITQHLPCF